MFNKFWKMKEGFAFGAGLIVVGLALQFSVGPIHWSDFAFPLNGIFLFLFLCSLGLVYVLRHKVRFFGFFHRVEAAVPILLYAAALTVAMGLTRQVPAHERAVDPIGLTQMLSFWPFVLVYLTLAAIVGLIVLRQVSHFRWRELPSMLCHVGLFIAIVSATLGSADMERVKLKATTDMPPRRAPRNSSSTALPSRTTAASTHFPAPGAPTSSKRAGNSWPVRPTSRFLTQTPDDTRTVHEDSCNSRSSGISHRRRIGRL